MTSDCTQPMSVAEQSVSQALIRMLLDTNGDLAYACQFLASVLGSPVILRDRLHARRYVGTPGSETWVPVASDRLTRLFYRAVNPVDRSNRCLWHGIMRMNRRDIRLLAVPLIENDRKLGCLVLYSTRHLLPEPIHSIVLDAAAVLTLELARRRVLHEVSMQLRRDLLIDLLSEDAAVRTDAVRRAQQREQCFRDAFRVVAIDVPAAESADAISAHTVVERLLMAFPTSMVAVKEQAVLALVPNTAVRPQHLSAKDGKAWVVKGIDERIRAAMAPYPVRIGVSREGTTLNQTRQLSDQALSCLSGLRDFHRSAGLLCVDDMGASSFFLPGNAHSDFYRYCHSLIAPILKQKSGRLLLETLICYYDCDFSRIRVAERMQVHINTVNYRLQRIEELTGRHLSDADSRLLLYVAGRLWSLMVTHASQRVV